MKIFDFLVKKAIFGAFLIDQEIRVTRYWHDQALDSGSNAWRESHEKRRNALKMAILTKKSKIFIKAKVILGKSCLLGPLCLMIWCILRDTQI